METMVKRKGSGRRKIEVKKIENKKSLQVTFSKRRSGLFKKAADLSLLCGVDIAVIVQSPAGKIFTSSGASSFNSIIHRYLAATSSSSANPVEFQRVGDGDGNDGGEDRSEKNCMEIVKEIKREKVKERGLMESKGNEEFWWERRFDDLDVNELDEYIEAMEGLRKNVLAKVEELARPRGNIAAV